MAFLLLKETSFFDLSKQPIAERSEKTQSLNKRPNKNLHTLLTSSLRYDEMLLE